MKQPYKVSLLGMANTQSEVNNVYHTFNHPNYYLETQFEVYKYQPKYDGVMERGENLLVWYYSEPFDGWYATEIKQSRST